MHTDRFIDLTAGLRELGGGRVWSLMISLFGDLAQEAGQSVDGPVLSTIMQGLMVKPEAARVALHRLRNDGWIESRKSGRISQHQLTQKGRDACAAASPRIYTDPAKSTDDWQLILLAEPTSQSDPLTAAGFCQIAPRVFIGAKTATPPADTLVLPGGAVPEWLARQAEPENLQQGYLDLLQTLEALHQRLAAQNPLSAVEIAVLRCLIVHNWRRLVLKHPALPAPLIRPDWPGHQCHLLVHALLSAFPRPGLKDLGQARAAA